MSPNFPSRFVLDDLCVKAQHLALTPGLVTETVWHKTQQVRRHEDGRVTLTFRIDGLDEIVWWVLGWSGRVKVIQPEALRQLVVEKMTQAIAMNQNVD